MVASIEFTQFIAPDGTVYKFDGADKFLIGIAGEGMPTIDYITQSNPLLHGETLMSYRLRPRIIQLLHRRQTCSRAEYWDARENLLDILRPNRHPLNEFGAGKLRHFMPNGKKRDIDVIIQTGPVYQSRSTDVWDELAFTEALTFIAFNPVFYNPDQVCETFVLNDDSSLIFPFVFPFTFTPVSSSGTITITYTGSWLAYPVMEADGPFSGIRFTNEITGEIIRLNKNVAAGETVVFDLREGQKSVTSSVYGDVIGAIVDPIALATFHLEPNPGASGGVNVISVYLEATDSINTKVRFSYQERFIGR